MHGKPDQNWQNKSYGKLAKQIEDQLLQVGIKEAEQETRLLMTYFFGADLWQKLAEPNQIPPAGTLAPLADFVQRRRVGEPLSQILGSKGFWTLDIEVNPHVLTPRADTETLVTTALRLTKTHPKGKILDLGTGSGAILLAFLSEKSGWQGTGVDISAEALHVARRNAKANSLGHHIHWHHGDWAKFDQSGFDLVVSNPPYIARHEIETLAPEVRNFEPRIALDGGPDGLDTYRVLVANLTRWLRPDGCFAFEIGHTQAKDVHGILAREAIFTTLKTTQDLGRRDRVVSGCWPM